MIHSSPSLLALPCFCPFILQYVPPDICICNFVLEQSLSVRALQEMLANTGQNSEGVSASFPSDDAPQLPALQTQTLLYYTILQHI